MLYANDMAQDVLGFAWWIFSTEGLLDLKSLAWGLLFPRGLIDKYNIVFCAEARVFSHERGSTSEPSFIRIRIFRI